MGNKASSAVIGIDLGTSYSSVAVWEKSRVKIIPVDEHGNLRMPSCVAFTATRRLIGHEAEDQIAMNATNTITESKSLIGRRFSDLRVRSDFEHWPFEVIPGHADKTLIVARYKDKEKHFSPEEIIATILAKLIKASFNSVRQTKLQRRQATPKPAKVPSSSKYTLKPIAEIVMIAGSYLGCKVRNAVIAVPASFTHWQRRATMTAARIAGLEATRLINEPSAAAIAFSIRKRKLNTSRVLNVLIFDLGGGKLNVSIVEVIEGSILKVRATASDPHLGGKDFDNNMVNYFAEEILQVHQKDIRKNAGKMSRLRTACERAKRALSTDSKADVSVDNLDEGIDFSSTISRSKFEEINEGLFSRCRWVLKKCLTDHAKKSKRGIDEVVLMGGSTRIPKIQELLRSFLEGIPFSVGLNRDEAVVNGAAIHATMMTGRSTDLQLKRLLLLDVNTHSLSLRIDGDSSTTVIVPKNTTIPVKKGHTFSTNNFSSQNELEIQVYEGEESFHRLNNLLGRFELRGVPKGPGTPQITVSFDVDASGLLRVSAECKDTNRKYEVRIIEDGSRLTERQIRDMTDRAYEYMKEDEEDEKAIALRNMIEKYALEMKHRSEGVADAAFCWLEGKQATEELADSALCWLERNESAKAEELDEKIKELKRSHQAILAKNKNFSHFRSYNLIN